MNKLEMLIVLVFLTAMAADCEDRKDPGNRSGKPAAGGAAQDSPSSLLRSKSGSAMKADYYVAPDGDDKHPGTQNAPFATVQHAMDQAKPGNTIALCEGVYRQSVTLKGTSGAEGAPITLKAYGKGKPVISGLDVLKLQWKATPQPGVYVAPYDTQSILQLFFNGKPMLEARWPNVPKDAVGEWNFFAPEAWASADTEGNSYGTLVCSDLAKTGWDVTGAQAMLNVDHQFSSWTRQLRTHSAGSNTITYEKDLGYDVNKTDEGGISGKWNQSNRFYLFGMRQFLDAPGEWFYDASQKKLFICSPDGKSPADGLLEIKTREWGLTADNTCSHLTIEGITFFGTAFSLGKDYSSTRSSHLVFRNNCVLYSSWTEYVGLPKGSSKADQIYPAIVADNSQVVNNTFAFGALSGLYINGFDNLIENNLFHDFDYNSSLSFPPLQVSKPWPAFAGKAGRATVRQNTICRSGGIQAQIAQADNQFSMNDVADSFMACYGGNKDTSAVYTQNTFCAGTRIHHNWVHRGHSGTPPLKWGGGIGIRGDDKTCGLTVDHNVAWDLGGPGIEIKNVDNPTPDQANRCINNTVFDHSSYNSTKGAILIASIKNNQNIHSTVANNLADSIYGWWGAKPVGEIKIFSNNVTAFDATADLVNTDWSDFRPAATAAAIIHGGFAVEGISPMAGTNPPDIGAYERGDSVYWIPGRREEKASFPIVPDKAENVPVDRDALMWKPAYRAVSHTVYFSASEGEVRQASKQAVQKTFQGEENVFPLPKLSSGQSYYWRVDATLPDHSVVQGDVWSFSTRCHQ